MWFTIEIAGTKSLVGEQQCTGICGLFFVFYSGQQAEQTRQQCLDC